MSGVSPVSGGNYYIPVTPVPAIKPSLSGALQPSNAQSATTPNPSGGAAKTPGAPGALLDIRV